MGSWTHSLNLWASNFGQAILLRISPVEQPFYSTSNIFENLKFNRGVRWCSWVRCSNQRILVELEFNSIFLPHSRRGFVDDKWYYKAYFQLFSRMLPWEWICKTHSILVQSSWLHKWFNLPCKAYEIMESVPSYCQWQKKKQTIDIDAASKKDWMLTWTSCKTDGTPPPYFNRPHPVTVAIRPVKSDPSGGMQIGTEMYGVDKPRYWETRNITNAMER